MGQYTLWEIIIIAILVLVVLGAGRIPKIVTSLLKAVGIIRQKHQ